MAKLFWILAHFFLFLEVAGQNLIIDKDQGDLVVDNNEIQTNLIAEGNGNCCGMVQLNMAGAASDNQTSRLGRYRQTTPTNYRQVGGKNYLYKWRGKAWYFGVDNHTSGVQSELTIECPDMVKQWRFWTANGDQEEWSDFQNNEIWVTCVDEDQMGPNLSENSVLVDEVSYEVSSLEVFQYSINDGPNVQCSNLDKTDPGYPPHPRIVLLGASGVGKSSLGNQLLGCYKKEKECEYFSVGHGSSSHTTETFWAVGNYLGKGGCVTLVDTPGASDSEGRDYEHALGMANVMKNDLKSVDVFLLMFNGGNPRFLASIIKLLKLYESIFSEDIWKHAITEISYWKWDTNSVEDRLYNRRINATLKHTQWNQEYRNKLGVTIGQVPTVFVDPVFPMFSKLKRNQRKIVREPEAVEKFIYHTSLLWSLANAMPEFHCKERCTAPQGYFTGAPWVIPPIVKGRLGTLQTSSCQIWKGIIVTASTKNVKWKFKGTIIFEKRTDTDSDISSTIINPNWLDKIKVTENDNEHFSEFQLTLQNLNLETHGIYRCENDVESVENDVESVENGICKSVESVESVNNKVEMLLIVDGSWSSWGSWDQCSISCLEDGGKPGNQSRSRKCISPKNGGMECIASDSKDQRSCAGDDMNFKFCPVNHSLSDWSEWTNCSMACGNGKIWRSRQCREGRHGGTACPQTAILEETQLCNLKPCPVDSQWTHWSECGQCSVTCGEGTYTRVRTCTEQRFGGVPCDQLDGVGREVSPCRPSYGPCPQDCEVSQWSYWGDCNFNCGNGIKKRTRTVTQEKTKSGKDCQSLEEINTCFLKVCPPCKDYLNPWTEWTSCTGGAKTQTRRQSIDIARQKSQFTGLDCSNVEDITGTKDCPVQCGMAIWGPSFGDGEDRDDFGPLMFSANHVVTNEEDLWYDFPNYPRSTNYWITEDGKTGIDAQLYMVFACPTTIRGFMIKNTHNADPNDRGTENFKIFTSSTSGPWTPILERQLPDARVVSSVPVLTFALASPITTQYVMFQIVSFYGIGGGLQYLSIY